MSLNILLLEDVHASATPILSALPAAEVVRLMHAPGAEELKRLLADVQVLGLRSRTALTPDVLVAAPRLLAVGAYCTGTNNIDLQACAGRGVAVFNGPFSNTRSVAELVIGHAIHLLRRIPERQAAARRGQWLKDARGSNEIRGKTLGIVGYGKIGTQTGLLAEAIGMRVLFHDVEARLPLGNARSAGALDEAHACYPPPRRWRRADHGARQPAACIARHDLHVPSHRRCPTGQAGGRPVRRAAFVAYSRLAYTHTAPPMQPITCDACRQPALSHDVVNYGSMEGGYRQLCGRCFNEAAASRLGLQGFEHVVFEPVRMVDGRGAEHEFQFRTRLFGPGMAIDAFELRDGRPAGYEFQVIGEPDDDPLELLGKLIGKMRRALALTHLEDTDHGPQVNDRLILRGTVDSDPDEDHRVPMVVIDGREIPWDELGRMVAAFEGWQFKLEFRDRSDEV